MYFVHLYGIGLHWEASPLELSRPNIKAEMHEWTSSLPPDKYEVSLTDTYIKISAKFLTDVPARSHGLPNTRLS